MGIPTASEFDNLVTPLWKQRKGEMVETYLAKKLAERWLGRPLASFSGGAAEQGTVLEGEAIPWYQCFADVTVQRVGFITTDDGRIGCSPDGLITPQLGIEVKCPEAHTHIKYLLAGKLPDAYAAQVQGSMLVTGAVEWMFLSYCRLFPPLLLTIKADPDAHDALSEALDAFNARLDSEYARLIELNGGPPLPREVRATPDIDLSFMEDEGPTPLTEAEAAALTDKAIANLTEKGL